MQAYQIMPDEVIFTAQPIVFDRLIFATALFTLQARE